MSAAANLRQRCQAVSEDVARVASECGRTAEEITIVAVSKTRSLAEVLEVVQHGFGDIGESRVQETEKKFATGKPKCRLHLIGHLQRNKVRKAVALFDMIQSVDSIRLAEKIDEESGEAGKRMPVLLEVNTSGEEQKFGFSETEARIAADKIGMMKHLSLDGLMTVGPLTDDANLIRASFGRLRRLLETLKTQQAEPAGFRILSMGMSDDYQLAIQEGANLLRIGTALFGPRVV